VSRNALHERLQVVYDYAKIVGPVDRGDRKSRSSINGTFFIWGCRVSTGGQIEELQAEVPVRTLVKQPAKQ
jgi:hypothetical protein